MMCIFVVEWDFNLLPAATLLEASSGTLDIFHSFLIFNLRNLSMLKSAVFYSCFYDISYFLAFSLWRVVVPSHKIVKNLPMTYRFSG